jgi:hypothetical protein
MQTTPLSGARMRRPYLLGRETAAALLELRWETARSVELTGGAASSRPGRLRRRNRPYACAEPRHTPAHGRSGAIIVEPLG